MLIVALMLAQAEPLDCSSGVTPIINQCAAADLADSEERLRRYLSAARKKLLADPESAPVAKRLDEAQSAWETYRDAECNALYDYWSGGTIRTVMALSCKLSLTDERTHVVWQTWLTYPDSTPPLLPEPGATPMRGAVTP